MESPSAAPAALSGRRVAILGGFLLLGALAFVVWLLLNASPASAQSADPSTTPDSSTTQPAAQEAAPSDSPAPPADADGMGLPNLLDDLSTLTQQAVPPMTEVLPPPLQPVASNVVEALPAPVRAPIAPLVAPLVPPPSATWPSNPLSDGPVAGDPASGAATTPHGGGARPASHAHRSGELGPAEFSSLGEGTRAPPTGIPAGVAASDSSVSSSSTPDSGSSLLLLGVLMAGAVVLLGRGRRLLVEALAWLPAPWCALPELPG